MVGPAGIRRRSDTDPLRQGAGDGAYGVHPAVAGGDRGAELEGEIKERIHPDDLGDYTADLRSP